MSTGIIYIATGKKYIDEACQSAASLKAHMPTASVTLFADQPIDSSYFDDVVVIENPEYGFIDKIMYMNKSPYDRTIFIDTDTRICDDISDLFVLLDRFDIAVSHEAQRGERLIEGVPECFPELNTGVVPFRKTPQVEAFFLDWLAAYKQGMQSKQSLYQQYNDQPSFQEVLYHSDLRVATLTPEYNCRCLSSTFVSRKVKILHLRHPDLSKVEQEINRNQFKRIFYDPEIGLLRISQFERKLIIWMKRLKRGAMRLSNSEYEW
ncbi:hypothetical protein IQ268_09700 [Oculatella sp. LEGE 06141]|uniref:hypothetical protein n=1 Tax=Oculatella sp. LEGE 06141 TaxID=1828648 RepID=UPI00187E36FD|nr:hypothetical protein [Oculatella sp. LEGE 06141]MBE9178832.1 hypothetical protein [Oculatella sp. LEGE 06141]